MVANKIGRNDPCPCGSGKKYKKCCFSLEATELTAVSGNSCISNDLIPDDVPRVKLVGKVLSNDGVKAEVDPQDGTGQMVTFDHDNETPAEFAKAYPLSGRVEIQRLDMREHIDEDVETATPLQKMQADLQLAHSTAQKIFDIFEEAGVSEDLAACTTISMALSFIEQKWGTEVMEQIMQAMDNILPHRKADAKFWNLMEDAKEYDKPARVADVPPREFEFTQWLTDAKLQLRSEIVLSAETQNEKGVTVEIDDDVEL